MPLPLIQDCKEGHCRLHFPQFKVVSADDLKQSLLTIIKDGNDWSSYFCQAYSQNRAHTMDVCHKALALMPDLVAACTLIQEFAEHERALGRYSYISCDYYLDKHGGVAKFIPCCR